ncbi:MAG: CbiX/SirB N-terminal domain-containing protein [Oleiphilaceae bacterium]|nr:CbiX/SirB N-terminal domain-containing protein [Oleiphilaceae bacterium]
MAFDGNSTPALFLVDNGSLRPGATQSLRRIAARLSEHTGLTIQPASLLHSNKIDPEEIDGIPATTLGPAATRAAEQGHREILVLPLFFGPSKALDGYLPQRMATLQEQHPGVTVRVANPLVDLQGPLDLRLARLLRDSVLKTAEPGQTPAVALVDHGSPAPEVTAVRNVLAGQLSALLEGEACSVAACSMERREGDEYRFNEPLLEHLLEQPGYNSGPVVLAMLFLSPGRHAGPGGDVETICMEARQRNPGLETRITPLAGEHEGLLEILADRLQQALSGERYLLELPGSA